MKKIVALLLALVLCLSLIACGGHQITNNASSPSDESDSNGSIGGKIEINFPTIDLDLPPAVTVSDLSGHTIEIDLPDFDFELSYVPVEVKKNDISFEFGDYQFTFDVNTFDVSTFAEVSADNFSESDAQVIEQMDVEDVVSIAETRANLLADLSHAFKTSGLAVTVNEDIGEIMLDSSVLFDVDKATISAEGEEFLRKFLAVYTTVVFNEKYDGFISKVMVEGHTDSSGNYDYNMTLSQNRADSVMAFCMSEESGVEKEYIAALEKSLEAIGYSCDKLIYDESGNEDMAASRRVSFRFLISLP